MKFFNLLTLSIALLFGVNAGLQAQCGTSYSWNANGNVVTFSATQTGMTPGGTYYSWDFGDNTMGSGQNVVHTYTNSGLYWVCLVATDSFCTVTYCDSVWVNAGGNPCSSLSTNTWNWVDTASMANGLVYFGNSTTGGNPGYSYNWDFGDGSGSTLANPTHQYNNPNQWYWACLTVTDAMGCTAVSCDTVMPNNPCADSMLYAYFQSTPNGNTINFTSSIGGTPSSVYWIFGDGGSSTLTNPAHTYNQAGTYTVQLWVNYPNGCSRSYTDVVVVNGGNPCAGFSANYSYTTNGNTAVFNSSVTGGAMPYTYSWNFGDGNTSTLANPSHLYNNASTYGVFLIVADANGCSYTVYDTVVVNNGGPCVNPTVSYQYNTTPNGTTFTSTTSGFSNTWLWYSWTFSNGNVSYNANPTVNLTNGWHWACVTVQDSFCTATYCDSVYVNNNGNPCAGFSANYTASVNGSVAAFNSTVVGGTMPYTYSWNFGDGTSSTLANPTHTYPSGSSSYGVFLIVTDANGCAYTVYDTVSTNNPAPCTQNEVIMVLNFDNYAYETSWDLRDNFGAVVASGSGYTLNQNGTALTQVFCLPTGCYTFNIYDTYGDGICCLYGQGSYTLMDVTTGATLASGGAFGYSESTTICVGGATNPCSGFNTSFTSSSAGNVVNFAATNSSGFAQYIWDFGDNTTGSGANPVHTYTNAPAYGYYTVCVTAFDSMGCTATWCDTVAVSPAPCAQNQVTLTLNFDNFASETTWDVTDLNGNVIYNGGGYTSANNGTTMYLNLCLPTGCYNFNIYDSYGDGICCSWGNGSYVLSGNAGNTLAVGGQFGYADHTNFCVGGASNPCGNFTGSIAANAGSNGAYAFTSNFNVQQPFNYQWSFGDGNSSNQANPNHTYANNGTYVVCMTADSGNCVVTYCDTIMVMNASGNPGGSPCANLTLDINMVQDSANPFVIYMQPVVNGAAQNAGFGFFWDFGDNTGSMAGSPGHVYNNYGSYVVCIMALDTINNCVATFCDTITIDSFGNFSRNLDYKDVKPGFYVNTLPPVINYFTGINTATESNLAIELFPNPASNVVNVAINSPNALNGEISILDIAGKAIHTQTVTLAAGQQQITLPVSQLPAGVYLVNINGDTAQQTMKFIKE